MTPTRKGNYKECNSCKFKIKNSDKKYPCELSHKMIRKNSGSYFERDFTSCGVFEKN